MVVPLETFPPGPPSLSHTLGPEKASEFPCSPLLEGMLLRALNASPRFALVGGEGKPVVWRLAWQAQGTTLVIRCPQNGEAWHRD